MFVVVVAACEAHTSRVGARRLWSVGCDTWEPHTQRQTFSAPTSKEPSKICTRFTKQRSACSFGSALHSTKDLSLFPKPQWAQPGCVQKLAQSTNSNYAWLMYYRELKPIVESPLWNLSRPAHCVPELEPLTKQACRAQALSMLVICIPDL